MFCLPTEAFRLCQRSCDSPIGTGSDINYYEDKMRKQEGSISSMVKTALKPGSNPG